MGTGQGIPPGGSRGSLNLADRNETEFPVWDRRLAASGRADEARYCRKPFPYFTLSHPRCLDHALWHRVCISIVSLA